MHMHSHGSFAALPLVWYWEYTRNATFLTDTTLATADPTATPYELFRGLANWWVCHLTKEEKEADRESDVSGDTATVDLTDSEQRRAAAAYTYVDQDDCAYEDSNYYTRPDRHPQAQNLCNATAQELEGNNAYKGPAPALLRNPAISMGFLLKILGTAIETSTVLGRDADLRPAWQDRLDNLAAFPTAKITDPLSKTNATIEVFIAQENPSYFPGSTNPLDLYAMWPGETVGASSPKALREIGKQTVVTMGGLGSWMQGNAMPEIVPAAVRAGVEPLWILGNISLRTNATMAQGGVTAEGAETQGVTQGINDMLCSSYGGVLRLFDVWPPTEDASFLNLRAKGGFLVNASLQSGQTTTGLTILSEQGGTLTLQNPQGWSGGISVKDSSGDAVETTAGPPSEDGVLSWTWPTKIAEVYTVNMSA
jgi:hypothetical protein